MGGGGGREAQRQEETAQRVPLVCTRCTNKTHLIQLPLCGDGPQEFERVLEGVKAGVGVGGLHAVERLLHLRPVHVQFGGRGRAALEL